MTPKHALSVFLTTFERILMIGGRGSAGSREDPPCPLTYGMVRMGESVWYGMVPSLTWSLGFRTPSMPSLLHMESALTAAALVPECNIRRSHPWPAIMWCLMPFCTHGQRISTKNTMVQIVEARVSGQDGQILA